MCLSILFGKRFDDHGLLEGTGFYHLPTIQPSYVSCSPCLPQNSHRPRKDLELPLNLCEIWRIGRLLADESLDRRFIHFLRTAGQFYLRALQTFERQPDVAYLDLITAGEVLSNFFHYEKDDLLDEQAKELLSAIEVGLENGRAVADLVRARLLQVKRRFVKTVCRLINDYFFTHSECEADLGTIKRAGFDDRVSAAYDLRSKYLHTGTDFGGWVSLQLLPNNEVLMAGPVVEDPEFRKALSRAPTYFGLERIIRYCLLRFMHVNGIKIDPRLDDEQGQ